MSISAKVICDSVTPNDDRLITLEVEMHRFILPEWNTHRMISRNFQSSRAVPVDKMIEQVCDNPAIPVHWGKNQRGMQAEQEVDNVIKELATQTWEQAAKHAAGRAVVMKTLGVHKQVINRLLEPFMWTKGVVTATQESWEAMFKLRCHKDAQPEFKALADMIKDAINNSTPFDLDYGEWHLPYVDQCSYLGYTIPVDGDYENGMIKLTLEQAIKVSTSCCAQVSYRVLDNSLNKAEKIYEMLNLPKNGVYKEDPPHFSPTEHIAVCTEYDAGVEMSGNFYDSGWFQYRKLLERGVEQSYI